MEDIFAKRMQGVPRSFIREILKVSMDPTVISFAGGLPNPAFFPVKEIQHATEKVFAKYGGNVLQYSNTEGDIQLREKISERYLEKQGIAIAPENIFVTNGSQQGIDLLGKVLLNDGDKVLMEEPGYLGTIQSLSLFRVQFLPVPVSDTGMDVEALEKASDCSGAKMLYTVPNFQNPSGITYSNDNREDVAAIAKRNKFILVEDNPYGELRFSGQPAKSFFHYAPDQTVLLGSFSKVVAPGFRLGWIAAPAWICEKLIIAKQAADLHTSSFSQKILCEFLQENDLDEHIKKITDAYGTQCRAMQEALVRHFPASIGFTHPEGGMFLWGRLPNKMNSMELFQEAVKKNVVFVPGDPFYTGSTNTSAFRLNFSCADPEKIEEGVKRMGRALEKFSALLQETCHSVKLTPPELMRTAG
jgi:2-aminoadipate transaminase